MNFPSTPELTDLSPRERILLTAHDLFYRDGVRATGVDKVIAEAKVTKVTFYRHFPSKQDLIRAYLDYRHSRWITWFSSAIQRHQAQQPADVFILLPVLQEWFQHPIYRGCAFINVVAELGDSIPGVIDIATQHKQDMQDVIASLLPDTPQRTALASAIALAVDGAIFRAQIESSGGNETSALAGLEMLLQAVDATVIRGEAVRGESFGCAQESLVEP